MKTTIGTYVPGRSCIHSADPRTKLLVTMMLSIALFSTESWKATMAIALVALAGVLVARIPFGYLSQVLKPLVFIAGFTFVVHAVTFSQPLATWWFGIAGISWSGLTRGVYFVSRLAVVVVGSSLITLTTSPVVLTDGLTRMMGPLRVFKVPVDDIAMMLSIALRFVPTIADEANRIIMAQSARGARFDQGGLIRRARAWLPVMIPLMIALFRRADALAIAMESRCYTGQGRTRMHELRLRASDIVSMMGAAIFAFILIIWGS